VAADRRQARPIDVNNKTYVDYVKPVVGGPIHEMYLLESEFSTQ